MIFYAAILPELCITQTKENHEENYCKVNDGDYECFIC
jgi:hypothetical protein